MKFGSGGVQLCLWVGMLLAAPEPAFARQCSTPSVGALAGVERSRWNESDARGAGLVREDGNLGLFGIEASLACESSEWIVRWSRSQGSRQYAGVTNTGVPVGTSTQLRADRLSIAILHPLDEQLSVGIGVRGSSIHRSIESSGLAAGYPERFRYWSVVAGARYTGSLGDRLTVSANGWVGGGPGGRLWVDLPKADPAELRLGSSRLLELGLRVERGEHRFARGGWFWSAGLTYRYELLRAGDPKVVSIGTVPVGLASQPRTTQSVVELSGKVGFAF